MAEVLNAIKALHDAIITSNDVEEIILHIEGDCIEYRIIRRGDTHEETK